MTRNANTANTILATSTSRADIVAGRYGSPRGVVKKTLALILDVAIRYAGSQGLRLAPFFMLHGVRQAVVPVDTPATSDTHAVLRQV